MSRRRRDEGQATVELALVLPVVCALLLGLVQLGLVVHAHLLVVHAAREGARAAAVDPHPAAATVAVAASSPLEAERTTVSVRDGGSMVTVEVTYRAATDVPLVGSLFGDVELRARASMRREY
jgi:Flp pilus assembly protein TadG